MSKLIRTTEERLWLEVTQLQRKVTELQRLQALPVYRRAITNAPLTLGVVAADVPNLTITPGRPGTYMVWCFLDISVNVANNVSNVGTFVVTAGTVINCQVAFLDAAGGPVARATVGSMTTWSCPSDTDSIKVQAVGSANAVVNNDSILALLRVGP